MENYLKTVLYAYPFLKTVGQDYEQHIRNKALLSYDGRWDTLRLAEYLAEEVLHKNRLEWLKQVVEGALGKLSVLERELIALRYFGKKRKRREGKFSTWSDRKYFRVQQRTGDKLGVLLKEAGVTQERFVSEFASIAMIAKIHSYVEGHNSSS